MRHMVGAVFARHVVEHLLAPGVVEVDVDIGHGDAVRVQETFEKEVVLERVDIGDAQSVGDCGAGGGAAAGADPDAKAPRSRDIVVHNEEVAREAHRADCVELELYALFHILG